MESAGYIIITYIVFVVAAFFLFIASLITKIESTSKHIVYLAIALLLFGFSFALVLILSSFGGGLQVPAVTLSLIIGLMVIFPKKIIQS